MLQTASAQDDTYVFPHVDLVTEKFFSDSIYFELLEAFFEGMNWPTKYENSENCRLSFSALLDDFFFMAKNRTAATDQEERFFNVTGVFANNFAETFYQCFVLLQQIQQQAVTQENSFLDTNDKYTSFLFNLLSQSIVIREFSYDLLDYSAVNDWVSYTRSAAGIVQAVLYFESSAAILDPNIDPDSPYYADPSGKIYLKGEVDSFLARNEPFKLPFTLISDQVYREATRLLPLIEPTP